MLDQFFSNAQQLFHTLRRSAAFDVEILVPGLLILIAWPLLRIGFNDEAAAFMTAFVLAAALRLALKSEKLITRTRAQFSGPATAILVMIGGPGLLAILAFSADPFLCQRFLSVYFLVAAALYVLDVIDGKYSIVQRRFPEPCMRSTDAMMTRAFAVYNLAMVLANETLIQHASQNTWLLYFGLLPLLSNMVRTALVRTVQDGHGISA